MTTKIQIGLGCAFLTLSCGDYDTITVENHEVVFGTKVFLCGDEDMIQDEPNVEVPNVEQVPNVGTIGQALTIIGGVVPEGLGAYDNGTRDPIASSSAFLYWTYDSNFSLREKDLIMFSIATIDFQTIDFRLMYGPVSNGSQSQIHVDLVDEPIHQGCVVNGQSCTLGRTYCGTFGVNAGPSYKTCNLFRIELPVNDLEAYAESRNVDYDLLIQSVVRHELGHTVGLGHSDDLMSPGIPIVGRNGVTELPVLNECQIATLRDFDINTSGVWDYVPAPAECN